MTTERFLERRRAAQREARERERAEQAREAALERQRELERERAHEEDLRRQAIEQARELDAAAERARVSRERFRERQRTVRRAAQKRQTHAEQRRDGLRETRAQQQQDEARREERAARLLDELRADDQRERRAESRDAERREERQQARRDEERNARRSAEREAERESERSAAQAEERRLTDRERARAEERERERAAERSAERASERQRARRVEARPARPARPASARAPAAAAARFPSGVLSASLPSLRVRGRFVVDSRNAIVQLRGVTMWGLEQAEPEGETFRPISEALLAEARSWGTTAVCLALSQDLVFMGRGDATGFAYLEAVDETIAAAASAGMYTILQLSLLSSGIPGGSAWDPSVPEEQSIDFWQIVARRYADEPAVLFDLFRAPRDPDPADGTSRLLPRLHAPTWGNWLLAMLGAIRSAHPHSVVIVKAANADVSPFPLRHSDGSTVHNVIHAISTDRVGKALAPLSRLGQTTPVAILPWDAHTHEAAVVESAAVHLARNGIHWIAGGWESGDTQLVTRNGATFVPTSIGRAFRRALALPPPAIANVEPALRTR